MVSVTCYILQLLSTPQQLSTGKNFLHYGLTTNNLVRACQNEVCDGEKARERERERKEKVTLDICAVYIGKCLHVLYASISVLSCCFCYLRP